MSQRRSFVYAADGSIIWDVIGADSGDEGGDDEDELDGDENDGDEGDDEGDHNEGDEDGEDGEETVESLTSKLDEMTEKYERTFRRMQRADRAKTLANKKLKELHESGDGAKALEAANTRIAELEQQLAKAGGQDKGSIVHEEFRDMAGFNWHNPKLAFSLLNLDEVDVDENGKVDQASLKDAMKDLAKDHPYLVKAGEPKPKDDTRGKDEAESSSSGTHFSGKRRKSKIDREAMNRKYAALATR